VGLVLIPLAIGLFINPGTPTGLYNWEEGDHEARSEQYDSMDDRYTRFLLDGIIPDVVLSEYTIVEDPDGAYTITRQRVRVGEELTCDYRQFDMESRVRGLPVFGTSEGNGVTRLIS